MSQRLLLSLCVFSMLLEMFQQINRVSSLITPKITFANSNLGYTTVVTKWEVRMDLDVNPLPDLHVRLVFPFATATPITVSWIGMANQCDRLGQLTTVTSTMLAGDAAGAHFVTLKGANFTGVGKFYMKFKFYNFPGAGYQGLLRMSIVSTPLTTNFITYAYNNQFMNMYFYPAPTTGLTIDTSPTTSSLNYNIITKTFLALIDVTFSGSTAGSRLFFRVDKQSLRYDSAQTCEIIDVGGAYVYYDPGTYTCEFEDDTEQMGLFLSLKSGTFALTTKIRVQIKMVNPSIPAATSQLFVGLMKNYEPQLLEFVTVANAFTCTTASFQTGYPRMIVGPSLDSTTATYPNLPLFASPVVANKIIFNSIRINFLLDTDLPPPVNGYRVEVTVGGTAKTTVPVNYIYENLFKSTKHDRKIITYDSTARKILISNVGELSSLELYAVGFKVVLESGDTVPALGTIAIFDQATGTQVVTSVAPVNMNANLAASLTAVKVQGTGSTTNLPTMFYTFPTAQPTSYLLDMGTVNSKLGLMKSTSQGFTLRGNFGSGLTPVALNSYIEVITNKAIKVSSLNSWADSEAQNNCRVHHNNAGTIVSYTTNINSCYFEERNKGTSNQEYSLLRMGAGGTVASDFWWTASNDRYWTWRFTDVTVSHSMFLNDNDAAILDSYINIYTNAGNSITPASLGTPAAQFLDNMRVVNTAALTSFKVEHVNYFRHATDVFDDNVGSSFLRVSGILDGVNTFKAQKILLFFEQFNPQYIDSQNYEIGCSGSDKFPVRCFYNGGLVNGERACGGSTCAEESFKEVLEVHFTTSTIALANAESIQIIIPVKLKAGAHADITYSVSVTSVHTGLFSSYNQILEYIPKLTLARPTTTSTNNWASYAASSANINQASFIRPFIVQVDTGVKGVLGVPFNSKFNVDCGATNCALVNDQSWYSMTICGNWNFMAHPQFSVDNYIKTYSTTPDLYTTCVKNITYQYSFSGTPTTKYCLWCPLFDHQTANSDLARTFYNFILPNTGNNKWPAGTYSMFSTNQEKSGLINYVDFTLETPTAFVPNTIPTVRVNPQVWYKNYKSMKLELKFQSSNPIKTNGGIQVVANTILPLTFVTTGANTYCNVYEKSNPSLLFPCSAVIGTCGALTMPCIIATVLADVPVGQLTLSIYGVNINAAIAQNYATYWIVTNTAGGTAMQYYLDKSADEAFQIEFQDHPSSNINVPDVILVTTGTNDRTAISSVNITVSLGNSKYLYFDDLLKLEFDSSTPVTGYDASVRPFFCTIVDNQGKLITSFKTCYPETPATMNTGILIGVDLDSQTSLFNIVLESFDLIDATPKYAVSVLTRDTPTTTVVTQQMSGLKDFTASAIVPTMLTFSVAKSLNYIGSRVRMTFTIKCGNSISYQSRIHITLHKVYEPSLITNMHNCQLTDHTGAKSDLFCLIEKDRVLEITGFASNIPANSQFTILVAGLTQPEITSSVEFFYARHIDASGTLLESALSAGVSAPAALSSLGSLKLITIGGLSFSSSYIRSSTDLTFTFTPQQAVASGAELLVFLDFYSYEYFTLANSGLACQLSTAGGSAISIGTCTRIGKAVIITTAAGIAANAATVVKISNIVTSNYASCELRKLSMMIIQGGAMTDYTPAEYTDIQPLSADLDSSLIYLNFEGMNELSFIPVRRGIFNKLRVIRMDGGRFNDELNFTMPNTFNSQFEVLDPTSVEIRDSFFGEKAIPLLLGTSKTTITTVFLVSIGKQEKFKAGRFAPLPFLVIKITSDRPKLPVSSTLTVYRGFESLAFPLTLEGLPQANLDIGAEVVTFDLENLLQLKSSSSFTLSRTTRGTDIIVRYTKPITAAPVSVTTSTLKLTTPSDAPYTSTSVSLAVADLVVDASTKFSVIITDTTAYGCTVDIKVHMPLTVRYFIVPHYLYANVSENYIEQQLQKGIFTDGYIIYGKMNIERSLTGFDLCQNRLMSNTSYVVKMYYSTFVVQQIGNSGSSSGSSSSSSGFDPLKRPDFKDSTSGTETSVPRIDQGYDWKIFSTAKNAAKYGYIDITFTSVLSLQNKQDICCYFAQELSYPLENVWTNDSVRCPSQYLPTNVSYFSGIGVRRILESEINVPGRTLLAAQGTVAATVNSNNIRLYLMTNKRASQEESAWSGLTSIVFSSTFEPGLYAQYPTVPTISTKTPLLEVEQIQSQINNFATFTPLDDGKSGTLGGIKLKSAGIVYSMVVEKMNGMDSAVTYQHIRLGQHPLNSSKTPAALYKRIFASINENYNLTLYNMTLDQTYALYYYSTSQDPDLIPSYSQIYKLEFIVRAKNRNISASRLMTVATGIVLAMLLILN